MHPSLNKQSKNEPPFIPPHTTTQMSRRIQKVMTTPITQVFNFLQNGARIQIWLYENTDLRIEGNLLGFDEFMNIVLDDAEEILMKKDQQRKKIGKIMLKGDNISLIKEVAKK